VTTLLVALASYALGCFSPAYYLFRFFTGRDIRTRGSGNAGAKNIGRELGRFAFVVVFLIDFAKGTLAVWLARHFDIGAASVIIAAVAVVAGHIWPAQLQFRGGKGVATGLGALAAFDYNFLLLLILLATVAALLFRNFTLAGLVAILLTAISAAIFYQTVVETVGISILAAIVLFAHRDNLRELFANMPAGSGKAGDPLR
jgi:glycerol-3-phosphate acyltransferase PlsY